MPNANPALKGGCPGTLLLPRMSFPAASCGSCEAWRKQGLYSPAGRCLQARCLTGTSPPQLPLELVCSSEHSLERVRWLEIQKALQIIRGPQGKLLQGGRLPSTRLCVSWEQHKQPETLRRPSGSLYVFAQPGFAPLFPHQSRVGVEQRGEFPWISLQCRLPSPSRCPREGWEQDVPGQLARGTDGCTEPLKTLNQPRACRAQVK